MTSQELRKQHIFKFKKLPAEKRIEWALTTGHEIRNSLSSQARKIFDSFKIKEKKERNAKLAEVIKKLN